MCPGAAVMGEPSPKYEEYVSNWCSRCVSPHDGAVDGLTGWLLPANHVSAMSFFDHATYLLCGIVVSLTIVGELKDIWLCKFLIEAVGDKLSPKWRVALELTAAWRRFVFLPGVMITVINFVLFTGGGAMNVCFSTIALLFVRLFCRSACGAFASPGLLQRTYVRMRLTRYSISSGRRSPKWTTWRSMLGCRRKLVHALSLRGGLSSPILKQPSSGGRKKSLQS